jgi:GAF domain-containing protein
LQVQVAESVRRGHRNLVGITQPAVRRLEALREFAILDTAPEKDFDAITRLASEICRTPYAAITFLDEQRQWFKSSVGMSPAETPLAQSFCAHTIRQAGLLVVKDARQDNRFSANPLVTAGLLVRFYAGVTICASDGTPIGALCVLDSRSRPSGLSIADERALNLLVLQIESQLNLRKVIRERDAQLSSLHTIARDLKRASEHDPLTSLPNRALFYQRLVEVNRAGFAGGSNS